MSDFDTAINTVISTTTAAGWHTITTGMASLWVNLIYFGVLFTVAAAILGIFFHRRRRRGRK